MAERLSFMSRDGSVPPKIRNAEEMEQKGCGEKAESMICAGAEAHENEQETRCAVN